MTPPTVKRTGGLSNDQLHRSCRVIQTGTRATLAPSLRGKPGDWIVRGDEPKLFATLECELIDRTVLEKRNHTRMAIFDFIEVFYNPWRRHSSIGNRSPAEYERRWHTNQASRDAA